MCVRSARSAVLRVRVYPSYIGGCQHRSRTDFMQQRNITVQRAAKRLVVQTTVLTATVVTALALNVTDYSAMKSAVPTYRTAADGGQPSRVVSPPQWNNTGPSPWQPHDS